MGKSGGGPRRPSASVRERGARSTTAKTPEQAHAAKVAQAEAAVSKAQARAEAAKRAIGGKVLPHERHPLAVEERRADRALLAAKTRLANVRAANPSQTPAQQAHAAKSAQYEAKIAKREQELAQLRAEYAAHQRGETVTPSASTRGGAVSKANATLPPLIPIGRAQPGERLTIDPFAPPDPAFLTRVYGHAQLGRALSRYSVDDLKMAADRVTRDHPGTKPVNRGQRKALVDYIVRHVNGE